MAAAGCTSVTGIRGLHKWLLPLQSLAGCSRDRKRKCLALDSSRTVWLEALVDEDGLRSERNRM
jgi:hypothetical protein